jgi:hypothetical protein
MWTGFIWFGMGTSGRLLWTQQWTFGFHKRRWISWVAEWLLTFQEGLCSMELVITQGVQSSCAHTRQGGAWLMLRDGIAVTTTFLQTAVPCCNLKFTMRNRCSYRYIGTSE